MKISWNCLNEIIDINHLNIIDITDKLTLAGFEVDNITNDTTIPDTIFDINITANRQDIISFVDIATELSALLNIPIKNYKDIHNSHNNVYLKECSYIIKNVDIQKSNYLIMKYLHNFNYKITETILDIINFINLKWRQKIKIYKVENLQKGEHLYSIEIKTNNKGWQEIYTNDRVTNEITINNVKDEKKTQNLLLINHDLSKNYSSFAYQEICKILGIQYQTLLVPKTQTYRREHKKQIIICKIDTIKNTLGPVKPNQNVPPFDINTIITALKRLNFSINSKNDLLQIEVPKEREHDICNEIDIIEEIGRIYGFNNFADKLPTFKKSFSPSHILHLTQKIRRVLRSMGLHEIINYSLQGTHNNKKCLIINPLNQDQSALRNNLIESIILSKLYNTHQDNESIEIFEFGTIFNKDLTSKQYKESRHLCCLMGNNYFNQSTWQNKKSQLTWSQAKGHIEDLFEKINAQVIWSTKRDANQLIYNLSRYIHPTRSIYISHNNTVIGILSQLNHRINSLINSTHNTYFFEIDIIKLSKTIKTNNHLKYKYLPYTIYPKTTRDLSIKINSQICFQQIFDIISNIKKETSQMIESAKILNEYHNDKNIKTICLRITYRSSDRTLTNEEVEILDEMFKKKFYLTIKSKT